MFYYLLGTGVGGIATSFEGQAMEIDRIHSVMRVEMILMLQKHCELENQSLLCSKSGYVDYVTAWCINILKVCKLVLEESSCQHLSTSHRICGLGFMSMW